MSDQPRVPIRAEVKVAFEELGRSVRRGSAAVRSGSSREARHRSRSAWMWLYRGEASDDPAVARRVLMEHRRLERMWTPRLDSWWFRSVTGAFGLWCGALLVEGLVDGAPVGQLVGPAVLVLVSLFNLVLAPGIMTRRAARTESALAEAQVLIAASDEQGKTAFERRS